MELETVRAACCGSNCCGCGCCNAETEIERLFRISDELFQHTDFYGTANVIVPFWQKSGCSPDIEIMLKKDVPRRPVKTAQFLSELAPGVEYAKKESIPSVRVEADIETCDLSQVSPDEFPTKQRFQDSNVSVAGSEEDESTAGEEVGGKFARSIVARKAGESDEIFVARLDSLIQVAEAAKKKVGSSRKKKKEKVTGGSTQAKATPMPSTQAGGHHAAPHLGVGTGTRVVPGKAKPIKDKAPVGSVAAKRRTRAKNEDHLLSVEEEPKKAGEPSKRRISESSKGAPLPKTKEKTKKSSSPSSSPAEEVFKTLKSIKSHNENEELELLAQETEQMVQNTRAELIAEADIAAVVQENFSNLAMVTGLARHNLESARPVILEAEDSEDIGEILEGDDDEE